jgi:probable HAF family extracellular repeat protein
MCEHFVMLSIGSINDKGQIVGWWYDANGSHGFLATPAQ